MLSYFDPFGQQLIQIGSRSVPSVKLHIGPAKIVGDDEYKIWL